MSPLMTNALLILVLVSGFKSRTVSAIPVYRRGHVVDIAHQKLLQPPEAQVFLAVGGRQSRAPDVATTEDSYIEALRHSQDSRRKSPDPIVDHPHADSTHRIVQDPHLQFHKDFPISPTYEYAPVSRPITAMEKNYLKIKRPSPADEAVDTADLQSSEDEEGLVDEDQTEDRIESDASTQFARLIRRPYRSVASANSAYSIPLANGAKAASRKGDDVIEMIENKSNEAENTRILTKKKLILVRLPAAMEFITNRASAALTNGIRTVGSSVGLSSMLKNLTNRINRWLPVAAAAAAAVGGRKKRSVLSNFEEEKNSNKHQIKKRQTANDANKTSSIDNLAVRFRFRKWSPTSKRAVTSAHSSDQRSANSKLKNLKATKFKQILPWFYSKFSKKQKRRTSQAAVDIEQDEKLPDSVDNNVATLTSSLLSKNPPDGAMLDLQDTLSNKEGHAHVGNSKFTHGHGIIVPSGHVSTSSTAIKDAVIHGTLYSDDLSIYTHGHGVVIPNAPLYDRPSFGESALVSDVVDNQNILSLLVHGTGSSSSNLNEGHDDVESSEKISPIHPLIASLDGPVLTTGLFNDETDLALDDLESLMANIVIAPLQVQAVVAEDGSSSDAVIIESTEGNKPDSIPVVPNLANVFTAPSGSSASSSSSSSSDSVNSVGVVGGDSSVLLADPFALLNTIGLAAIGIFALTLPIWVPFIVARMKRRRNSFGLRSPFVFPIGSLNSNEELHPYSTLLHKLTPSDATFSHPGPLNSKDFDDPASGSYFGRKAARRRRRRSNRRNTLQLI